MHTVTRPIIIFLCLCLVVLLLFPMVGSVFYTGLVTKIMILSIFTISLDLLIGFTGLVSFGHAAFFSASAPICWPSCSATWNTSTTGGP